MYEYIERFKRAGMGLFVHFGLYSLLGKGEWQFIYLTDEEKQKYKELRFSFDPERDWAEKLVETAKCAGARYITITTRHHDGFSLYDTCGLSDFDTAHCCGRDLIREFVDACRRENILPFFYHTLLDWHNKDFYDDFPKYIDYLVRSVEILSKNYGPIGGLFFDGKWSKPDEDWQEDRIYATIRKYQKECMIINNTGLSELGVVGHPEIDSVTFERGAPCKVDTSGKPLAGEMSQILNDHWGYAADDCNYKSVATLLSDLIDCRKYGCNFLLNTGLRGDGTVNPVDRGLLEQVGKFIKSNHGFIYEATPSDVSADGAVVLRGKDCYYAVIKDVPMAADPNVTRVTDGKYIVFDRPIKNAVWLESGTKIETEGNKFRIVPFPYGTSLVCRVAKFEVEA